MGFENNIKEESSIYRQEETISDRVFNKGQGTGRESNPQQVSKARRDGLSERQGKYAGLSLMRF